DNRKEELTLPGRSALAGRAKVEAQPGCELAQMTAKEVDQLFVVLVLDIAVHAVPFAFIEVDFRRAAMSLQPIAQAVCHVDGPRGVLGAVTEKDRTIKPFDFD